MGFCFYLKFHWKPVYHLISKYQCERLSRGDKEIRHVARTFDVHSARPLQSTTADYCAVLPALELRIRRRQNRRHLLPAVDPAHRAVFAGGNPDPRHFRRAWRAMADELARRRGV